MSVATSSDALPKKKKEIKKRKAADPDISESNGVGGEKKREKKVHKGDKIVNGALKPKDSRKRKDAGAAASAAAAGGAPSSSAGACASTPHVAAPATISPAFSVGMLRPPPASRRPVADGRGRGHDDFFCGALARSARLLVPPDEEGADDAAGDVSQFIKNRTQKRPRRLA